MKKIFSLIWIFLIAHFSSFAAANGMIYFPLAWKIESNVSLDREQFTEAKITFKKDFGESYDYSFKTWSSLESGEKRAIVFFGEKTVSLPEGDYKSVVLTTKYLNDVKLNYEYQIKFQVKDNQLTPLSGILATSTLNGSHQSQAPVILINRFSLDYNDISSISRVEKSRMNFSNVTSPIIVQEMPSRRKESYAHYGMFISLPCGFKGIGALNFIYNDDPIYYFTAVQGRPQSCHNITEPNRNPVDLFLSEGHWKIKSISQLHVDELDSLGFPAINNSLLLKYYNTDFGKFLRNNAYSKNIARNLYFNVRKEDIFKPFFYAGIFEAHLNLNNADFANVLFRHNFDLRNLRKLFGQKQVYNGYTGSRIVRDKLLGTVIIVLRDVNLSKIAAFRMNSFKDQAVSNISNCIRNTAVNDPLISVSGSILFQNQPNDFNLIQTELKFLDSSTTGIQLQDCLKTKLVNTKVFGIEEPVGLEAKIFSL